MNPGGKGFQTLELRALQQAADHFGAETEAPELTDKHESQIGRFPEADLTQVANADKRTSLTQDSPDCISAKRRWITEAVSAGFASGGTSQCAITPGRGVP